jgi:para-aminobenzoate synthetase component 1
VAGAERPHRARPGGGGRLSATAALALELFESAGAFRALDAYLDDAGFWRSEGVVAELYLAYGLSEAIRRNDVPAPPEPCALPLLACRLVEADQPGDGASRGDFSVGDWTASWAPEEYAAAVEDVRAAIARGDVYQVNLVQHLEAPFDGDPAALGAALAPLRPLGPRPFLGEGWAIVSASPELFLARRGRRVWTMPIKGTRPLGESGLANAEKDRAEHVMIVDLERNDLSRVCEPGSVHWPSLMHERELAGVVHLVSTVEGTLREDVGLADLLEATFPGGSVTGAPKIAAVDHIAALEPVGRGASMGALGRLRPNGDLDLALTIRTFAVVDERIHLWVGGGIVWDSEPDAEIEESWVKARPLLDALRVAA